MDTRIILMAMALVTTLCSCAKSTDGKYGDYFENEKAVDLSDVLRVYEENNKAKTDSLDYDLGKALEGSVVEDYDDFDLMDNADFTLQLPQYERSRNPFLSRAEVFYNSCLLAFNAWSNYEMWIRELASAKEASKAIQGIGVDYIPNLIVRSAAKTYTDSLCLMMQTAADQHDGDATDLLMSYSEKIEAYAYKFYMNEEAFVDSLDELTTELSDKTKPQFAMYKQSDSDKRVELMLHFMNDCRTFDEQCSLLLNWADCEESELEDQWIVAVAGRLIKAEKYNPCLSKVWMVWRCLFQSQYYGISRDSSIPNGYYNEMRKFCYLTCLKRIEKHPNDVFAMNCASAVGGRVNINRFGEFPFGNEAPTETFYCLPNRYGDDNEESEDNTESVVEDSVE